MSDPELLLRSARGDRTAFELLYERHKDAVYRFAFALTRSEADAQDVVQESFLTLNRKAAEFDSTRAQLRTWLLGIARNLAYRRPGIRDSGEEPDPQTPDLVPGIEAALLRNEIAEAVRLAVIALPGPQREAIVLFEFEGLSLAETAAVLGVAPNAIKARLHRGRACLKASLPLLRIHQESRNI